MIGAKGFSQIQKVGRDLPEKEYEIKFELVDKSLELERYLDIFESHMMNHTQYIVDPVQTVSDIDTYFFTDNAMEYSVFRYENELMLKVKNHIILDEFSLPVFANNESFIYTTKVVLDCLVQPQVQYIGSMKKRRIKNFLLDSLDGKVYSIAFTICESNHQRQYQAEIEYNGYIDKQIRTNDENEIVASLVSTSSNVLHVLNGHIIPTKERKFQFVQSSVYQSSADKEELLIQIAKGQI